MRFDVLSENEVREKYRKSKNKAYILEVIAGLTCSTKDEVKCFLGLEITKKEDTKTPVKKKGRKKIDLNTTEVMELYKMGLSDKKIGKKIGVSTPIIRNWRISAGLDPNSHKRKR